MLSNASILITGGTGSFGHTFVPMTLKKYNPKRLVIFSRDEMKQWEMAKLFPGDSRVRFFIGDVRDKDRLYRALEGVEYVVHAAATKIVPTAEYNPFECVKTNINGAMNVIDACIDVGIKRVVALSTDKASSPVNLYGATKLASDKLFVASNSSYASGHITRFSVVRYGNVMGSRGSVIPFFLNLKDKGMLPITDARMTRFMITLEEGVNLVWHAFQDMVGGEIYVKKIPSMRITDIAQAVNPMARQEIIGIRPGEKLHEEMISHEDALHTYEYDDCYKILPAIHEWSTDKARIGNGVLVPEGFSYTSDNNSDWMSVEKLKAWIDLNRHKIGVIDVIPYGRQDITQSDIESVVEALRSDFLTQGPLVPRFEKLVADYSGARHGVAVNSATSALHIACLALGLGPGDWLWTSPNTFVATANCALYCGAKVDFVDIDSKTYNMSIEALEEKLRESEKAGCLPKIVVPVHFAGQPCDMVAIHRLGQRYGFKIIEDASHAIGASYDNLINQNFLSEKKQTDITKVGSCAHSDITVFSFHPVKIITTGEGGIALTNDFALAEKMLMLRSHGITRDAKQMTSASDGPWYYQQVVLGFNYRMTELQAALGATQLLRLDDYVTKRHVLAEQYNTHLNNLPLVRPWQRPGVYSAYHLYVIRCDSLKRRDVFEHLRMLGVGVNVHYIPVHTQPYYLKMGFKEGDFPVAEKFYAESITLPLFPNMTDAEHNIVVAGVREALTL